jgi:type VI secretion system secreted protein VgrG
MGWTWNFIRRKTRRRHRPELEHLDDRCLLSTSTGINLADHLASRALVQRHALVQRQAPLQLHALVQKHTPVRRPLERAAPAERTVPKVWRLVLKPRELERPAGTITSGPTTAYDPIIGAAQARSTYNVDGSGMTVAVIDTGVDYNNAALGGGFGPNNKVIAGYDFADNTGDPLATSSQHGTAIAGLIGSESPNDLGVAPGVKIVALRVTDSSNTGSLSSVASALQWVIDNHTRYNITAVNMSLSDGGNYAQNWFAQDGGAGQQVTGLVAQLAAMNIPVIAATGNAFSGQQGEGFAAIVAGTISVSATDLSGNLLPNAQRLGSAIGGTSATTIAAPGNGLTAPSGDSGTATVGGTSFATALVTGGVTLLQEIYQARFGSLPTVAQIKDWIQQSATPIRDSVTGITIGELNLPAAAALIPGASPTSAPPVAVAPVNNTPSAPPAPQTMTTVTPPAATPATTTTQVVTPPTTTSSPSPAITTAVTTTSHVQVYVNGQKIDTSTIAQDSATSSIDLSSLEKLFAAMSVWAAGYSGAAGQGTTQVQIWNA